jgi:hypothetical protein
VKRTAKDPSKITKPGRYGFGKGLWLTVTKTGGKSWSYRYTFAGRARSMGLGGYPLVSLEQARALAAEARKLARTGVDPIEQCNGAASQKGRATTFRAVAEALIADLRHGWRSHRSEQQWRASLAAYVYPCFGSKDVGVVTRNDVVAVKPRPPSRVSSQGIL